MPSPLLPSSPSPEIQGAAAEPSSKPSRVDSGRREFESVSRQEQDRLERRRNDSGAAGAQDRQPVEPDQKDQAMASGSQPLPPAEQIPEQVLEQQRAADAGDTALLVGADNEVASDTVMPSEIAFTFADLQALVNNPEEPLPIGGQRLNPMITPAQAPTALPAASAAAQPLFSIPGQTPVAGALRSVVAGAAAMTPGKGSSSLESGSRLTEGLLTTLTADSKSADSSLAAVASRFQGALEVASQALNTTPGPKGLEGSVPLQSYATSIDLPVGHAEWGDKLMGKLAWLATQKMSVAEIHVTPPDMGPLEVRVQVQHDQAAITVHASNSAVRDQLEMHSHRLRDMLSEQGLGLERFDVSDSSSRSGGDRDEAPADGSDIAGALADGEDVPGSTSGNMDLSWSGELDVYA
ncbi:flagellar hook-length control protein FliK [Marinobacter caseinilyticus]|uniref:flagellar hook-length control protein FliK n=1 Tax=Marinobacter caseinilyticus TaxID=2692195 RepID=UPI0014093355|nr:flagellar hook-length control protein FliK [Marinobacter caseinilyticus]